MSNERLYTVQAIARKAGTPKRIGIAIAEGDFPAFDLGTRWLRIWSNDFDRWAAAIRVQPSRQSGRAGPNVVAFRSPSAPARQKIGADICCVRCRPYIAFNFEGVRDARQG